MKKFLTLTIIAIIALIGLPVSVNAADVATEADLKDAVLTDGTITLLNDIELNESLEVGKNVTINLNGHSITSTDTMTDDSLIIVLHGGKLIIEGNGSISATNSASKARVAVKMTKADCDTSNPATLIVNSGTIEGNSFAISGNGNPDRVNTIITINGGTVKGSATGIYHPQEGKLTVNGGTVKGETGIEMRSGDLTVNNGTIIGTGTPASVTPNGNGTTTVGVGIAIAQHTTTKNINVVVDGGDIQGYSALYESNPQSNATMEKVTIEITGGEFKAINGGTVAVYSEDKTDFITGGTFSSDVSLYVNTDELDVVEDEDGTVIVGKLHTITVEKVGNGTVKASKTEAVIGQKVTIEAIAAEGYKLKSITGVDGLEEVAEYAYEFTMPDKEVTIIVEFEKIPTEEDKTTTGEGTTGTESTPAEDKKDETPKTGSVDVVLFASAIVAVISVAGIVTMKKYTR